MYNHKTLFILACIYGGMVSSCKDETSSTLHGHTDSAPTQIVRPKLLSWNDSLLCTGVIDVPPQNLISIHSPVSGFVRSVHHYPGSKVHKGEVLITLEHPSFIPPQRELLEAVAQRNYIKNARNRMQELSTKDAVSMKAFEEADAEYRLNESRIMSLKAQLKLMGFDSDHIANQGQIQQQITLRAPASGIITAMNVNLGKLVDQEHPLIQMVDTRHKHLELTVFAKDLPHITEGMKVRFRLNDEGPYMNATLFLINPMVDQQKNSVQVHAHLDEISEKNDDLKPGSFVQAVIGLPSLKKWGVPAAATYEKKGERFVKILRNQQETELRLESKELKQGYWILSDHSTMADSSLQILVPETEGHDH